MNTDSSMLQRVKQTLNLKRFMRPLLLVFCGFYLTYHALNGDKGIYAYLVESRKQAQLESELAAVTQERQRMDRRVAQLQPNNLDLDLLDEQMRRRMGLAREGELLVILE